MDTKQKIAFIEKELSSGKNHKTGAVLTSTQKTNRRRALRKLKSPGTQPPVPALQNLSKKPQQPKAPKPAQKMEGQDSVEVVRRTAVVPVPPILGSKDQWSVVKIVPLNPNSVADVCDDPIFRRSMIYKQYKAHAVTLDITPLVSTYNAAGSVIVCGIWNDPTHPQGPQTKAEAVKCKYVEFAIGAKGRLSAKLPLGRWLQCVPEGQDVKEYMSASLFIAVSGKTTTGNDLYTGNLAEGTLRVQYSLRDPTQVTETFLDTVTEPLQATFTSVPGEPLQVTLASTEPGGRFSTRARKYRMRKRNSRSRGFGTWLKSAASILLGFGERFLPPPLNLIAQGGSILLEAVTSNLRDGSVTFHVYKNMQAMELGDPIEATEDAVHTVTEALTFMELTVPDTVEEGGDNPGVNYNVLTAHHFKPTQDATCCYESARTDTNAANLIPSSWNGGVTLDNGDSVDFGSDSRQTVTQHPLICTNFDRISKDLSYLGPVSGLPTNAVVTASTGTGAAVGIRVIVLSSFTSDGGATYCMLGPNMPPTYQFNKLANAVPWTVGRFDTTTVHPGRALPWLEQDQVDGFKIKLEVEMNNEGDDDFLDSDDGEQPSCSYTGQD